ncbi:MAG: hypothetical protein KGL39_25660 [Patescibacteria group bacterium]|nr:hypothetical protein [Patescibacteria group bacterium]
MTEQRTWMICASLLAASLLLHGLVSGQQKDRTRDPIVGVWWFTTTSGTHPVKGTVTVWKLGDRYSVQYSGFGKDEKGQTATFQVTGTGSFSKEKHVLSVTWTDANKSLGLTTLDLTGTGSERRMKGTWVVRGGPADAQPEEWTWIAPLGGHK